MTASNADQRCPDCNGSGSLAEHSMKTGKDGEHDCSDCPVQAPCERCQTTGKIQPTPTEPADGGLYRSEPRRDTGNEVYSVYIGPGVNTAILTEEELSIAYAQGRSSLEGELKEAVRLLEDAVCGSAIGYETAGSEQARKLDAECKEWDLAVAALLERIKP